MLNLEDEEVLTYTCWTIYNLIEASADRIENFFEKGICGRVLELCLHPAHRVFTAALRIVLSLVSGDQKATKKMVDMNLLSCLRYRLATAQGSILKDICLAIAKIMEGKKENIQCVIEADIFSSLIAMLENNTTDVKNEVVLAIKYATVGTPAQVSYIVSQVGSVYVFNKSCKGVLESIMRSAKSYRQECFICVSGS